MNIAVCEDNGADRSILAGFCARYAKEHSILLDVVLFEDTKELLADGRVMDMGTLLLDIKMDGSISGVDAARALRKMGYSGVLLFITASEDYYAEGFEVGALHYLVKPVRYEDFAEAMNRAAQKHDNLERYITVMSNRRQMEIPLRHILYAAVEKHKTILHTTAGSVPVNIPFSEAQSLLSGAQFLKCYRSCVVNMDQIARVEEYDFILKDGSRVPIAKRANAKIKEFYMQYIFGSDAK